MTLASRVALALLSAILCWFSFNLNPLWAAAWVAPIPLFVAAYHSRALVAVYLTWLAVGIGLSSNFTYYLKTTGPVATVPLLVLQVLVWGFFVARARAAVVSSRSWWCVFVYPLLHAALSTLLSAFSPHGTWGSFAYTQMDAIPVIQIASLAGAPAITFVIALFASTVSVAIYRGRNISSPLLAYGLPALLIAGVLGYGEMRIHSAPPEPTIRIGLASVDDFIGPRMPAQLKTAVWQRYAEITAELSREGARIVVLPEKISQLSGDQIASREQQLASLAQHNHIYLAAGLQLNRGDRKDNAFWLFSPTGELLNEYHKQHLVPHLEGDLASGDQNTVRTIDHARFGLAICRDLLFSDFGRDYGRLNVAAMLAPAWDFYRDAWMASSVAALRGVESGYSVVRAGRESYLNVSDRYGRTIARKRSDNLPGSYLIADLPLGPGVPTFYARYGNIFGWTCVLLSLLLLIKGAGRAASSKSAERLDRPK